MATNCFLKVLFTLMVGGAKNKSLCRGFTTSPLLTFIYCGDRMWVRMLCFSTMDQCKKRFEFVGPYPCQNQPIQVTRAVLRPSVMYGVVMLRAFTS